MKKFKSVLAMSLASTLLLSGINPISVSADNQSPPVELTGIEDGAYTNSSAVTISGTNGNGVQKIVAGKNGALNTYNKTSHTIQDKFGDDGSLVESSDGYWVVKVYGNDGTCDSASFTIDKHAPEVNYLTGGGTNTKQKDYTVVQKNKKAYLVTFKDDNLDCVQVINDANWNTQHGASG